MIEAIISWCARNRFLVIICTGLALIGGWIALKNVNLDAIPDLSDVQVIVFTKWPGQAPNLVEDQVTYPIVSTLADAPRVKYARGQSFFGLSFVTVVFDDGTDMYWARSRVLEYLSQVANRLPPGVNPVLGPDATGVGWIYEYALVDKTGRNSLADLRSFQDWTLKYYLQNTPGVAEVASVGGYVNGYQVEIDPNKLLAYHIPINKVIAAIRASNNDVGGRVIEFGETEYMVRGDGYIKDLDDIRKIVVGLDAHGTPITIAQIAAVHRGPDMRRGLLEVNGQGEAVGGIVVMRYGANALKTIAAVKAKLKAIEPSLPPGVKIVTGYDRSSLILRAIATLRSKLLEESVVVSLICLLFLFHFRSALVAIITLPIANVLSFIPMTALGVTSNIMSLGGIAIAIGAMVDAAIVMIENAHKWLERWRHARAKREREGEAALDPAEREVAAMERHEVLIRAAQQVGKPLFFSLLIIAISFVPVFGLQGQSGRLFKPLAFTKTFAMAFASLLSVTLVPVLMIWFIRGRIPDERTNPINRFLIWIYRPFVHLALRFRWPVILLAVVTLAVTWWPWSHTGSEFMPPLNEGSLLYMPTSPPGMSIAESRRILQKQDAVIKSLPEVQTVYGKIGRADTATDPAPLDMAETVITLKPEKDWRPGMTFEKIKQELDRLLPIPGMPAIWWMPIQTRIEMLATGIRSQIGIEVMGPDLGEIQRIGEEIETLLKHAPHTASVFAERVTGGYYVDFHIDRDALARYGLTVAEVETVIETAIGGKDISWTVEGQERFPINVRYARDFRSNLPALRRVLVATPTGAQVPLGELARIDLTTGPAMIRDQNGVKAGFVFVDTYGIDLGSYVNEAKTLIAQHVKLPPGYYLEWGGQYQYMLKARQTLEMIIPLTLVIIFLLLYLNFGNVTESLIVLLSVPFALVGGIWLLWLLHYNFSVAVAVGFIALAGVAAETGVVMIVYLDEAWHDQRRLKPHPTLLDLHAAVITGAVQRVRPKMMTVCAIIVGLLPIMWADGTGADTMKRIAAPMIGGMISSTILTLVIVPAIYYLWRSHEVKRDPALAGAGRRGRTVVGLFVALAVAGGGAYGWHRLQSSAPTLTGSIFTAQVGGYRLEVLGRTAQLGVGANPIRIEVFDAATGKPADVGSVTLRLHMDMPGMPMEADAVLQRDPGHPGVYVGTVNPGMGGAWTARLEYSGPAGRAGKTTTLTVKT